MERGGFMLLYDLKEGQSGIISNINIDSAFAGRLRDMGFCEGERAVCVKRAALRSPVLYNVKGSNIALRKTDAVMLEVEL